MNEIKLTQYSKGAGCGCKIAPGVLEHILRSDMQFEDANLLLGYATSDDAALYDIGNGQAVISTTDFFTPIVDDANDFGKIAAANAISDVYAMGGKPLMAVAILGWPVEKLPVELAQKVLDGARSICKEAGIPLAGGHSIDSAEPIFGLAVTGILWKEHIKKNNSVLEGDLLFLTKPLGSGILSSALKRGQLVDGDYEKLVVVMTQLNKAGEAFGKMEAVHAMTDVTGFGLAGHLLEMLRGSDLAAEVRMNNIPKMEGIDGYISKFIFPDNTTRIYNDVKENVAGMDGLEFILLCDPQTSGGLLVSVDPGFEKEFLEEAGKYNLHLTNFGRVKKRADKMIELV
ncbi:MAG TPA: selenide, water dikinase SelD [Bacteroidia bacterium]